MLKGNQFFLLGWNCSKNLLEMIHIFEIKIVCVCEKKGGNKRITDVVERGKTKQKNKMSAREEQRTEEAQHIWRGVGETSDQRGRENERRKSGKKQRKSSIEKIRFEKQKIQVEVESDREMRNTCVTNSHTHSHIHMRNCMFIHALVLRGSCTEEWASWSGKVFW